MLTQVQVKNSAGSVLYLKLGDVSNGFIVEDITGLSPVKATMVSTAFADAPGAQYQTSRRDTRNIVYTIGFRPGSAGDISSLREILYSYFLPQSTIAQTFTTTHMETVSITGVVESFEMAQFSKTPTAVISVICYDPDFMAAYETSVNSTIGSSKTITYTGTYPTGLLITLTTTGSGTATTFSLKNVSSQGTQTLGITYYTSFPTSSGKLILNTTRFNKSATVVSGSTQSNALAYVNAYSDWIQLHPGSNVLTPTFARSGVAINYKYNTRYGGI